MGETFLPESILQSFSLRYHLRRVFDDIDMPLATFDDVAGKWFAVDYQCVRSYPCANRLTIPYKLSALQILGIIRNKAMALRAE